MNTARRIYESDDDGVVHVDLPVGRSRRRVEVLVVWEDAAEPEGSDRGEADMADLVGLLEGIDIERPQQGAYEERDPLT